MKPIRLGFSIALLLAQVPPLWAAEPIKGRNYPDHNSPEAAVYRGEIVFKHYCVLCHGVNADGNGRAAKLYNPRPANLVLSDKNPQYKEAIVRLGGTAMGRSEFMPPWNNELTNEQITDVVAFLGPVSKGVTAK